MADTKDRFHHDWVMVDNRPLCQCGLCQFGTIAFNPLTIQYKFEHVFQNGTLDLFLKKVCGGYVRSYASIVT